MPYSVKHTSQWIQEWIASRWTRHLLGITVFLCAWTIHAFSKFPVQTPISEELARKNPLAILFMAGLIGLVSHMMYSAIRRRMHFQGWTLLPMIPALVAIAFTSPTSEVHLQLFTGVALYGFAWLSLFSYLQGSRAIAFATGILFILSIVCLIVFFVVGSIFPWTAYELSPLGVLQKIYISVFTSFALSTI